LESFERGAPGTGPPSLRGRTSPCDPQQPIEQAPDKHGCAAKNAGEHIIGHTREREEWKRNLILTCVHWHPVACCCYNPRRRQV
jgi:hypothetical protein